MSRLLGKKFALVSLTLLACFIAFTSNTFANPSKAKRTDMVREQLKELGYNPTLDDDGDLLFKASGYTFLIILDDDDDLFYRIIVPGIDKIDADDVDESMKKILAVLKVSKELKSVKICFTEDVLSMTYEGFYDSVDDFNLVLERLINLVSRCVLKYQSDVADD